MPERRGLVYCFRQESGEKGAVHRIDLYDTVTKYGSFNWQTWDYNDSETSAKHFRDLLQEIPDGDSIHLHINSQGGEVGEGVTIYNLLRQKSQAGSQIIGFVDGMAYSVAADIAMACDELHMGLGTSMLLHYPWMVAAGNAEKLREYADQLDALGEASVQLYMARAKGLAEDELREMMRRETMMDPETCLKFGFCDIVDKYEKAEGDPTDQPQQKQRNPEENAEELKRNLEETREQLRVQQEINQAMLGLGKAGAKPEPVKQKAPGMAVTLIKAMQLSGR